jgi:Flp pilus assembly protein TadG
MAANLSNLRALWVRFKGQRNGCHKRSLSVLTLNSSTSFDVSFSCLTRNLLTAFTHSSGQAVVEFTLVFLLFLVIAWIPADFGLAFYTGQLTQNASREAARIAAADPNLVDGTCNMPCSSAPGGTALKAAADRMSRALLPGALISVTLEPANGTNCNRLVEVTVSGEYNYFFYQLLRTMGNTIPDTLNIVRSTSMRWEHQPGCQPGAS